MAQYILLIHNNAQTRSSAEEWDAFFRAGQASGMFVGGSGLEDERVIVGDAGAGPSANIVGYMRFDADDRQALLELLQRHPIVVHGGSVELCEMAKE